MSILAPQQTLHASAMRDLSVGAVLIDSRGDRWQLTERLNARPIMTVKHTIKGTEIVLYIHPVYGAIEHDVAMVHPHTIRVMQFRDCEYAAA
jgi:hypothetical protein